MAIHQSTCLDISSPLVSFGHALFGPGAYSDVSVLNNNLIPFSDWRIPASQFVSETDDALCYGRRAAATLAIHTSHMGVEAHTSLLEIIGSERFQRDLNDSTRPGHFAAEHFIRQISRYLWALGQLVSPLQLAADAEAYISEHRAYTQAEDLDEEAASQE